MYKGRTIRNHGRGIKIFQWMNFFFSPICLHEFFFDVEALHDFFFPTELLLILKAYKAPHSLITVPLKVTVSLESRFSRSSSIAIIEKEMSY